MDESQQYEEDFIALVFQVIVTEKVTIEHKYIFAILLMPGAIDHPILAGMSKIGGLDRELDELGFLEIRGSMLECECPV